MNNGEQHSIGSQSAPSRATISKGRKAFCVIFKHPLRAGPDGKPGLRVRRGLGTDDKTEAQGLVDQLNELLANNQWHTPGAREAAAARFAPQVVAAFYHKLVPEVSDPWELRERIIAVPTPAEGYCRVKLIGTTGAGKTTLLRQLIGTDPETERFPSTSTAKTTTSEIEVILRHGEFQAVVTFMPRDHVRLYIEECLLRAADTSLDTDDQTAIARDLLEHTEQRFRLRYILGGLAKSRIDEVADEEDTSDQEFPEFQAISEEQRSEFGNYVAEIVERIQRLGQEELAIVEERFKPYSKLSGKEKDALLEEFERQLQQSSVFQQLVDDVLEAVELRFEMFAEGKFELGAGDWPETWTYSNNAREKFISAVKLFSSNHADLFGKLLTPLVTGIRVAGPFVPAFGKEIPKLVLMDGEGIGHAASTATSVSTEVTKRYALADTMLLIDSGTQPMLSGPVAVLRSLVASGHDKKLAIVFTHFDQVKGPNLPDLDSRKAHLLASLNNAISAVGEALGEGVETALRLNLQNRVFFLSSIQKIVGAKAHLTRLELGRLLQTFTKDIEPPVPTEVAPVYDEANLILSLQSALVQFRDPWRSRLGFPAKSSLPKEHWTRIKALARRFAQFGTVEYDDLRPVADLLERMKERLTVFLSKPVVWEPGHAPDEMKREAVATIQRLLAEKLMQFSIERIRDAHLNDWILAYAHRDTGSALRRSTDIEAIFDESAPLLGETPDEVSHRLIQDVRKLTQQAIESGNGRMLIPTSAS